MTRFAPRSIVDHQWRCADEHARRLRLSLVPTNAARFANRVAHRSDSCRRMRLAQVFELLETVVLLTGFDNPVGDVNRMDWLVYWNGKSFDAARSNEAVGENAVATFAYRMMLNMNGLRGNEHET